MYSTNRYSKKTYTIIISATYSKSYLVESVRTEASSKNKGSADGAESDCLKQSSRNNSARSGVSRMSSLDL